MWSHRFCALSLFGNVYTGKRRSCRRYCAIIVSTMSISTSITTFAIFSSTFLEQNICRTILNFRQYRVRLHMQLKEWLALLLTLPRGRYHAPAVQLTLPVFFVSPVLIATDVTVSPGIWSTPSWNGNRSLRQRWIIFYPLLLINYIFLPSDNFLPSVSCIVLVSRFKLLFHF